LTFADLGLGPELLKAVEEAGYSEPTPIQQQAIPIVLMGRDVLGVAQTGTGKTAGFTLPMIEILAAGRAKARMPRSLIIAPTRELAAQVSDNFEKYGKYHKLTMALLIGGESFADQERLLDRGVDVLIATPGRLLDLFERGRIILTDVKILVIDEADRMLDMGFIPDVERIVSLLPKIRQTLFFSATMAPEIRRLADAFLINPKEISVAPQSSVATTVSQFLVVCSPAEKRDALEHLIGKEDVRNAIIFCNRKRDVDALQRAMAKHGFDALPLHGDMSQPARTETLDRFRRGEIRLLVCSDVAARGLDISNMSHVFNYDVPTHAEDYIHRIGRTGRAGKEGRAFTLAAPEDGKYVAAIEALLGRPIPRTPVDGIGGAELDSGSGDSGKRRGRGRGGAPARPANRDNSGRDNSGRDSQRARPGPDRAPPPTPEHPPTPTPAPVSREAVSRPQPVEQRPRSPNRARSSAPAPRRDPVDRSDGVVGFGSDLPDFMRVSVPKIAEPSAPKRRGDKAS
jgi:superfamily II DNA/RNA helicase